MKYRQFAITLMPDHNPTRVAIHDPATDVKKYIPHRQQSNELLEAIDYLRSIGIPVIATANAIRRRDVRLLTTSDQPLR